jgi:hypothetical protein
MNKKVLARNLAYSLTLGAWSKAAIQSTLTRRLPRALHRLADAISSDLVSNRPYTYSPNVRLIANALRDSDQFERVFRYCSRRNIWPGPDLSSPVMSPVAAFAALDIPQLATLDALSDWLSLPIERLDYLADLHSRHENHRDTQVNHYHYVLHRKKSGGMRVIEAPKPTLKTVQRQILHGILDKVPAHPDAFGFAKGRSCLDAANRHAGEQVVICFDLKDFFPSIGAGRIFGLFRCLGYPHQVASCLAALCTSVTPSRVVDRMSGPDRDTYRKPHLPQGSPASPGLANLAVFTLDKRLSALAKSVDANYSRYADDLSFSGDRHIAGILLRAVPRIIEDEGFQPNPAKTRIMSRTSRQVVTGVVVNHHLNVTRKAFDHLKAIIHACGKAGDLRLNDPVFRTSLLGKIGWVEAVNPHRGQKLLELLSTAVARRNGSSYPDRGA